MVIGVLLIIFGILISLFGVWQSIILRKIHSLKRKVLIYAVSILITALGVVNIVILRKESCELKRLHQERLILTDLKIKFEILAKRDENTRSIQIIGSQLKINIYSKKDTLVTSFYLQAPLEWDILTLPEEQVMCNIFFCSHPEIPPVGKRIILLEKYDSIKFPLGRIAKEMGIKRVNQILKVVEGIYINGIEARRVEFPIENVRGNTELEISESYVQEWFSKPFRGIEECYLQAVKESTEIQ